MTRRTQALRRLPDDARVSIADGFAFPEPPHGERWVVGAVIYDERGRIFIQRRAKARSLFPGAWDLVGGHLEPGESVLDGLLREVREETGWHMTRIVADLGVVEWVGSDGLARLEADYLV
ncbi:MAG: NUDIX hydrolase, partial [Candidatus Limnocylindria bacterium]